MVVDEAVEAVDIFHNPQIWTIVIGSYIVGFDCLIL